MAGKPGGWEGLGAKFQQFAKTARLIEDIPATKRATDFVEVLINQAGAWQASSSNALMLTFTMPLMVLLQILVAEFMG